MLSTGISREAKEDKLANRMEENSFTLANRIAENSVPPSRSGEEGWKKGKRP